MDDFLRELLSGAHGIVAHATIFGILVACGLGVPLPEDISLILGGYLAHAKAVGLVPMMFTGFAGILAGDSLIFAAGRRLGGHAGRSSFFSRIITPEKRRRVEGLFALHGQKIVMIARFLPGVRAVTYFTAGSAGMSYWRFAFWDGVAAMASAPLFVFLGYHFGGELEHLFQKVKDGQAIVVSVLLASALGYFLYRRRKNAQLRRELKPDSPEPQKRGTGGMERSIVSSAPSRQVP